MLNGFVKQAEQLIGEPLGGLNGLDVGFIGGFGEDERYGFFSKIDVFSNTGRGRIGDVVRRALDLSSGGVEAA